MSLLLNMLSRSLITFLQRSKRLLISWLQSPSAVILEAKKKQCLVHSKYSNNINYYEEVKSRRKTTTLTRRTFVGKVMSLLFNMLSRLVITFLPRSKRLLISWLQSPSAVILEAKNIKSDTIFTVSPSICHEVMGPDAMIFVFWVLSWMLFYEFQDYPIEITTHSNIFAWKTPQTEGLGSL